MNAPLFIAKRITGSDNGTAKISTPIVNIAIIGIALGLAIMILSIAIVTGFKNEVRNRVTGFGAHIQITNFDSNKSFETEPINKNQVSLSLLNQVDGIKHAQVYITKAGIIKTKDNIQAIVLKGIDQDFDWSFFNENLIKGESFVLNDTSKSNKILISEHIANLLGLDIDSKLTVYFVQDPPRMRPFIVSGIYKTSIEEFDKSFAIIDLRHLQKLNGWNKDLVSGYEIIIDDFNQLYPMTDSVFDVAGYQFAENGAKLKITNIEQRYPQIFDWLNMQNTSVWIILVLMLFVAGFNMISGLLILILEKTNMIGLLKGLGYDNWKVRKIFIYQSGFLISKGMFWGNLLGIGIALAQKYFSLIPLDESIYIVNTVSINLKLSHILMLNAGTLILTVLMMILPTYLITKISPAKAIKFN